MDERTRIEKILQHEGMSSGQFAQEIGIQNSTLSHILNNRNNPSLDVMKKILNRFPLINSDWLILGQGAMFRQESHSQMPTLFGFDDENSSLSEDLNDKNVDIFTQDNSSKENYQFKNILDDKVQDVSQTVNASLPLKEYNNAHSGGESGRFVRESQILNTQEEKTNPKVDMSPIPEKKVTKIILYYSDNTFQEFDSK